MKLSERQKQVMIIEKLRLLQAEVSALIEIRADILHTANEATNKMVLLQASIEKNLPES